MTIDNCVDSTFVNNILDSNNRHGINVVTAADNNTVKNNVVTNNLGNGITVQAGSDLNRTSNKNKIIGNTIQGNKKDGLYVYRSSSTEITSNTIVGNSRHGIHLRSASSSTVSSNTIDENGLEKTNTYIGIYLDDDTVVFSTNNLIQNNIIRANTFNRYKYGIAEKETRDDFNTLINNTIQGITIPIRLQGANSSQQ
jgi:parallel beta-helix repeat protein